MAATALYAGKINQMPSLTGSLTGEVRKSVEAENVDPQKIVIKEKIRNANQ